jgi:YidC/Oxa1 family membrane protein insertase
MNFLSDDGKKIDSRDLFFDFSNLENDYYKISGDKKISFRVALNLDDDKSIIKSFTFFGDKYHFENDITLNNLDNIIPRRGYNLAWTHGLKYQEYNTIDESNEAIAMAVFNDESQEIDATEDEIVTSSPKGTSFEYAGIKSKYFAVAIKTELEDATVDLKGYKKNTKNEGVVEYYDLQLRVPYEGGKQTNSFLVYIGPLDSDIIQSYGFNHLINYGWWIFRYIGQAIFQFLSFLQSFIPNWGVTIIIFSIFLKFALYPLSAPQMRSSQKMKLLAPQMTQIREKYKDDMQKQQREIMNLYSEYGVNPMGGCFPMLLQMPILYTLWTVFRTNLNLRQADFAFWINDLSMPDTIIDFGFSLMGLKSISGLALLMGVTMFVQQKLTITDPRQKSLVYMMPIMFTLMFSNFPSGLNLYYFMFNLIGIGQQIYINKFSSKTLTLEQMKQSPKKESWMQKKMKQAQELAEMQQKGQVGGPNLNKYIKEPKRRDTKRKK